MVETISANAPRFTRECDQCGQRRTELYLHRNGITAYCEGCYLEYRRETDGRFYPSLEGIIRAEQRAGEETSLVESAPAPAPATAPSERETARFLIRLDLGKLEEMTGTLRQAGIDFDPVESMVCLPPEMALEAIFTGADMECTIRRANRYLEEKKESHRIQEEFWRMPPATRRDLMALLTLHSDWDEGRRLNDLSQEEWRTFREKHREAVTAPA